MHTTTSKTRAEFDEGRFSRWSGEKAFPSGIMNKKARRAHFVANLAHSFSVELIGETKDVKVGMRLFRQYIIN